MITLKDADAKEKETVLDDDASIYQRREKKTERQKFSEMKTPHDKLNYFRMYYLRGTLAAIVVAGLLIYLVYTILSPKDHFLLRVAFIDYLFDTQQTDQMAVEFIDAADITLNDHELISFDGTSYQVSGGDYNAATVFATHVMAKEIDMIIAPESVFTSYAFNGTLYSLTELLPSDLYAALSENFFLSQIRQENETLENATGDKFVLGIYLDETPFWDKFNSYTLLKERPVIGIIGNAQNKDMAIRLLRYLFDIPALQ